jgi:hypothetical protein
MYHRIICIKERDNNKVIIVHKIVIFTKSDEQVAWKISNKKATVATVFSNHLFPFRTEKLRLYALMVLRKRESKCRQGLRLRLTGHATRMSLVGKTNYTDSKMKQKTFYV